MAKKRPGRPRKGYRKLPKIGPVFPLVRVVDRPRDWAGRPLTIEQVSERNRKEAEKKQKKYYINYSGEVKKRPIGSRLLGITPKDEMQAETGDMATTLAPPEEKIERRFRPERAREFARRNVKALFGKDFDTLVTSKGDKIKRSSAVRSVAGFMTGGPGQKQAGPGRPRGTYKYGMPIHQYMKLQAERKAKFQLYQQQQGRYYGSRGVTPEQFRQMQLQRSIEQPQQAEQQIQQMVQQEYQETPEQIKAQVEDETAFRKWSADKTISPNTRAILTKLMRVQNKARNDDIEMQRRIKERKMVAKAGSLLATPYIFNRYQMNLTGVSGDNILKAENVFTEREDNKIMRTNRPNILQTKEAGNNLF